MAAPTRRLVLETVGPNVHERRAPRRVEGGQAQFSLPSRSIRSLALDVPIRACSASAWAGAA